MAEKCLGIKYGAIMNQDVSLSHVRDLQGDARNAGASLSMWTEGQCLAKGERMPIYAGGCNLSEPRGVKLPGLRFLCSDLKIFARLH